MGWWQDFMRRVNRANTHQAQLVSNQHQAKIDRIKTEVRFRRDMMNAINITQRRCKIGWVRLKGDF